VELGARAMEVGGGGRRRLVRHARGAGGIGPPAGAWRRGTQGLEGLAAPRGRE
jgi:hypothetical protein